MTREWRSVEAMISLYCRAHHDSKSQLCPQCSTLAEYARNRLAACPYQQKKPTCSRCPIHCYKPSMRAQIQRIMRYAGPRMLWHHPLLALGHMRDGCRKPPDRFPTR